MDGFPLMSLILMAPNEISHLPGPFVSDYVSYVVANLIWSSLSSIMGFALYLLIVGSCWTVLYIYIYLLLWGVKECSGRTGSSWMTFSDNK